MEYFNHDLGDGTVALVPFPADLPLAARAAYMAAPPADAIATARRLPASLFAPPHVPADVPADVPDSDPIPENED